MNRTRLSLYYLGSYLTIIGIALLVAAHATLAVLQSNGDYGVVFPRVAGMLTSGLGFSIFGMIGARSEQQYPTTLLVRTYFLICIAAFYLVTVDRVFLVLGAIVALGFVMTLGSYLADRMAMRSVAADAGWVSPHVEDARKCA
jgi:hypothetical protein